MVAVAIPFTEQAIEEKLHHILAMAKKAGATDAEVNVQIECGYSATARMGEAETLEYNNDNQITIVVYQGKKSASVTISDLQTDTLQEAVAAALRIAQYAEPDPYVGIAEKQYLSSTVPKLTLNFPWELSPQNALDLAAQGDQVGLDFARQICNSDGTTIDTHTILKAYANSHDFCGAYTKTRHSVSSVLVAASDGEMQRDYYYYTACDAKDLPNIELIAELAAKRTLKRLSAKSIKTQRGKVLFAAESARSLISHFVSAISGSNLYNKSSFLLHQLDKPIFPDWFDLTEAPHLTKALGSSPFDDNGLITFGKAFVKSGHLKNYALGVYSARKLNLEPTANAGGLHNLLVAPGQDDFQQMLQRLNTGLLVTEVMGPGVNIITGDYSRGVAGFWVEHGEIIHAVDEATIAGNLSSMFKNISAVGNDIDKRGNIHTPSILVEDLMMAGQN